MKFILHIDMNAFFASVEELQNPKYVNKPIAVSGKTKRSVIASANYIARAKGVKAAMPVYQALNLCPDLIIVIPHFDLYQLYSQKFLQLIEEKFTTRIEHVSIDECYADITNLASDKQKAFKIAAKIQATIFEELKLKCSIGISTNKFLAKMASDFKKPFGISTLYVEEIKEKLWPLNISEMLWIGNSTASILKQNGINTIGDMANKKNEQIIKQILNKNWYVHIQHANGIGNDELDYSLSVPKSISSAKTFLNDTDDFVEITNCLKILTNDVVTRLKKHNLLTKTITVYVKTTDFVQHNKSYTLSEIINDEEKIWINVIKIFQTYFLNKFIRLIGVKLDNLFENEINLFSSEIWNDSKITQPDKTSFNELINKINKKFDRKILDVASNKFK